MSSTQGTNNNVIPVDSSGNPVTLAADGTATLVSDTTYYFPLSDGMALCQSVHMRWGNNILATITFEDSNFNDPSNYDSTAGNWIQENPISAYVAKTGTATVSGMTITTAGGGTGAGGAVFNIGNIATRRQRLKVVVAGTGGTLRVSLHGKQ
jgi:hypothetical protein